MELPFKLDDLDENLWHFCILHNWGNCVRFIDHVSCTNLFNFAHNLSTKNFAVGTLVIEFVWPFLRNVMMIFIEKNLHFCLIGLHSLKKLRSCIFKFLIFFDNSFFLEGSLSTHFWYNFLSTSIFCQIIFLFLFCLIHIFFIKANLSKGNGKCLLPEQDSGWTIPWCLYLHRIFCNHIMRPSGIWILYPRMNQILWSSTISS